MRDEYEKYTTQQLFQYRKSLMMVVDSFNNIEQFRAKKLYYNRQIALIDVIIQERETRMES